MARVMVRYMGIADERELTVDQLGEHGIRVDRDLVWSRSNGFRLALDVDDRMMALLRDQGHFSIHEIKDDESAGEIISAATEADNPGDTVVDETSGQKSKRTR